MDWGDTWSLHDNVTPDEAYKLGKMVAAMVETSLSVAIENALEVNMEAFRTGLKDGLASSGLNISVLRIGSNQPTVAMSSFEPAGAKVQAHVRQAPTRVHIMQQNGSEAKPRRLHAVVRQHINHQ